MATPIPEDLKVGTKQVPKHPPRRDWARNDAVPPQKVTEDYALISRFMDSTTGQMVVVAAGLRRYGTLAAGKFLTDASHLAELGKQAPHDWAQQNPQVVIATKVIEKGAAKPQSCARSRGASLLRICAITSLLRDVLSRISISVGRGTRFLEAFRRYCSLWRTLC